MKKYIIEVKNLTKTFKDGTEITKVLKGEIGRAHV